VSGLSILFDKFNFFKYSNFFGSYEFVNNDNKLFLMVFIPTVISFISKRMLTFLEFNDKLEKVDDPFLFVFILVPSFLLPPRS
jgi:hypothetical protein